MGKIEYRSAVFLAATIVAFTGAASVASAAHPDKGSKVRVIHFKDRVRQLSLNADATQYRILFQKHAAYYNTPKSGLLLSCLEDSAETHSLVTVEVEAVQLTIITCKPVKSKK